MRTAPLTTVTVWQFDTAEGADAVAQVLVSLATEQEPALHDAATISWPAEDRKPLAQKVDTLRGPDALGDAFWGMFFGIIFFMPLLGGAIGAASGDLSGSLADIGIDDPFIHRVRDRVTPGTSALFLLASHPVVDRMRDAFGGDGPTELAHAHLTHEQETALREVFTA
jgi:uncharacterized membrane protein